MSTRQSTDLCVTWQGASQSARYWASWHIGLNILRDTVVVTVSGGSFNIRIQGDITSPSLTRKVLSYMLNGMKGYYT